MVNEEQFCGSGLSKKILRCLLVQAKVLLMTVVFLPPSRELKRVPRTLDCLEFLGTFSNILDGRVHWRHLANTIEPSMCGGDAAC